MIINILLFTTVILALLALEAKKMLHALIFFGVFGAISCLLLFLLKIPEPAFLKLIIELGIIFWLIRQVNIEDYVCNAPKSNLIFLIIFSGILAAFCLPLLKASLAILVVALYGLVVKRNLIKNLLGLIMLEYGLTIMAALNSAHSNMLFMLISLATTLTAAVFILWLYQSYNTLDISKIRKLEG